MLIQEGHWLSLPKNKDYFCANLDAKKWLSEAQAFLMHNA